MGASTDNDIAAVEALLRNYGDAHLARRKHGNTLRKVKLHARALAAACVALFVFAPASALTTVFLMTADSAKLSLDPPDAGGRTLLKSDRLLVTANTSSPQTSGERDAFVHVVVTTIEAPREPRKARDEDDVGSPLLMRGRLEDDVEVTGVAAVAEAPSSPPPRQRRQSIKSRVPLRIVAEIVQPETTPPSFLERLFGSRSL